MQISVCHLTTGHGLLDDRIFHKEAVSLAERGFRVTVLGPSLAPQAEKMGVTLKGIRPPSLKWRLARKLLLLSRLALVSAGLRCRVYHCHEMDAAIAAVPRMLFGAKLVYDVHEHFPENYEGRLPAPVLLLLGAMDRLVSKVAHLVITVDETLAQKYRSSRRTVVVHNYPILSSFPPGQEQGGKDTLVYVGGLTEERGVLETVEGFGLAQSELAGIRLKMIGKFIPEGFRSAVKERVASLGLEDAVTIVDWIPFEKIPETLSHAAAGVSFLRPIPRYSLAIPIKVYEYMAAGIPVIAGNFENLARLVEGTGCGVLAEPGNAESLGRAIVAALGDPEARKRMGENGRRAVRERFNWERESDVLARAYEEIV